MADPLLKSLAIGLLGAVAYLTRAYQVVRPR
jgi:hypothetical protein